MAVGEPAAEPGGRKRGSIGLAGGACDAGAATRSALKALRRFPMPALRQQKAPPTNGRRGLYRHLSETNTQRVLHIHAAHATHAAARGAMCMLFFLRRLSDHDFRREQQARYRSGVLQSQSRHLGGI
jgi:hypothetical protein